MCERKCRWCKTEFTVRLTLANRGWAQFCSNACKATFQRVHNKKSPTQKKQQQKATDIIDKAFVKDESFAEYDRICQQEDGNE